MSHSRSSILLLLHPSLSPSFFSLSPCISHFAKRCENQYFLATSASRLEVGIEKGTPSAHSFINIYPHLNPSETESSPLSSLLLRPFLLPVLVLGLSPSSRPNSQACICSCKSFIRFVRGFASITAMGDPNRLFHLGFISPPILPCVLPLLLFYTSFLVFRFVMSKFSLILCLFLELVFFG